VYGQNRELLAVEIVAEEADVIRESAASILAGASLRSVVIDLNRRGVPSAGMAISARTGSKWQSASSVWESRTLRRILISPAVAGLREHQGKVAGKAVWPAIIEEATWRRLVDLLTDPARGPFRGREVVHPLSGVLRCAACDGALRVIASQNGGPGYVCATSGCFRVSILKKKVEPAIRDLVLRAVADRRFLKSSDDGRLTEIREELTALRGRLDEAVTEAVEGRLSASMLAKVESMTLARIGALEAESRRLTLPVSLPDPVTILTRWDDLPAERQRHIIRLTLGDRIIVRSANRKHGQDPLERLVFPALSIEAVA
jgi:hypothetical protein